MPTTTRPLTRLVAIYAYGPITVVVNQSAELRQMGKSGYSKLTGETKLEKGIYRIDGDETLLVSVGGNSDVSILDDKGEIPDPKVASKRFINAFANDASLDLMKFSDFFIRLDRGI